MGVVVVFDLLRLLNDKTQCSGRVFTGETTAGADIKTEDDSDAGETATPHDSKPFECAVCSKRFKYKGSLHIHHKSHAEARTAYQCSTCRRPFTTEGRLLRHEATHADDRQMTGVEENGAVSGRTRRADAAAAAAAAAAGRRLRGDADVGKVAATVVQFKCVECGRCYRTGSALRLHARSQHATADPQQFACSICDKQFTRLAHLERHSVIHTGLKPHKCPVCGKARCLALTYSLDFL